MTTQKRQRVLIAIFVVAVAWGLYRQPWKSRTSSVEMTPDPAAETPAGDGPQAVTVAAVPALEADLLKLEWTPDPFRPAPGEEDAASAAPEASPMFVPVLQGTMAVKGTMQCVLDGRVFKVGDGIGRWTVERIEPGSVIIRDSDGGRVTLRADNASGT